MVFIVGPQSWRGSPTPDAEAIVKELAQGVVKTSPCFLKKTLFVINDGPPHEFQRHNKRRSCLDST